MNICFVTDPLVVDVGGSVRPALLVAKELRKLGHTVTLISPHASVEAKELAEKYGIKLKDLGVKPSFMSSLPTFEAWTRSLFKRRGSLPLDGDHVLINTSSCFRVQAEVYYAQGPMTRALDDMLPEMPKRHKFAYHSLSFMLRFLEKRAVKELRQLSKVFMCNSKFCASMYEDYGVEVDGVFYPPLDCEFFKPATSKPSLDYVLTYIGPYSKETRFSVLRMIADAGVKIKAFGYKAPYVPSYVLRHLNITFLGRVSSHELVNLYSNALYTLFTFHHEPFGYVPIESMACGTPVLTYDRQGPRESVIKGVTGWLAKSDEEIIRLALKLWKTGYPESMRTKCTQRASEFDVKKGANKWVSVIKEAKRRAPL